MRAQAIITITVITIGVDFFFIIFHLLQNSLQHLVVVPSIANHKSQNPALVADNVTYVIPDYRAESVRKWLRGNGLDD